MAEITQEQKTDSVGHLAELYHQTAYPDDKPMTHFDVTCPSYRTGVERGIAAVKDVVLREFGAADLLSAVQDAQRVLEIYHGTGELPESVNIDAGRLLGVFRNALLKATTGEGV